MSCAPIMFRLTAVAALVVAALVVGTSVWYGGVNPFPESRAEASGEATVRISAQQLVGGRTMLGLQVQTKGEWNPERLSPTGSLLPANPPVGRWMRTSPIELQGGLLVRVAARLLESGQVEVGLHEVVNDEVGELLLPERRLFPRDPGIDRWLNSSPLTLGGTGVEERFAPLVGASGRASAAIEFRSWHDDDGVHTWVTSRVASEDAVDGVLYLTQACWNSRERRLWIDGLPGPAGAMLLMTSEAPGPQMADFGAVEVDLAIDGGDTDTQYWRLIGESGRYTVTAGTHAPGLLEALRGATSLTVSVIGSSLPKATFDLRDMFDTRVQGNIDECGNYADPAWTPVTEARSGTTEAGATYSVEYPDWLDGVRLTQVLIHASTPASEAEGQSTHFWMDCRQGRHTYEIGGLPSTPEGEYVVRSRVDDGDWIDETGNVWVADGGFVFVHPAFDYERLRGGETLMIEIALDPTFRATFDLAALFDTPVQPNIDNCGVRLWSPTYVPVMDVSGSSRAGETELFWSAFLLGDDVLTHVDIRTPVEESPRGFLLLSNACHSFGMTLSVGELERTDAESLQVTLEIDGIAMPAHAWSVTQVTFVDGSEFSQVDAPNPERLAAQLRYASSLTVAIDGSGLPPVTFDLAGMFDTPIQENIDNCGNYKPGETRE